KNGSLRDRARSAEDRRLRRRDRRACGRGVPVRPARPGRARHRFRHAHPAVPPGNEIPAERGARRRRGEAHPGRQLTFNGPDLMADIKTFYLPDLGEGLPDATVVEWHVKVGDSIKLDAPLCSMETAKAVVDVPSPYTGKVTRLYGAPGDIIETGAALADFEPDPNAKQRAESQETGHHHGPKKTRPHRHLRRPPSRPIAKTKAPWSARWSAAIPCTSSRQPASAA